MTPATPPPSSRLVRAAAAERTELDRHHGRLVRAREGLREELARIDRGLAEVDERRRLLDQLAPSAEPGALPEVVDPARRGPMEPEPATPGLRGPAIRETAVRVLREQHPRVEAMHYRSWFELLQQEGYTIVGKDPLAVFLTQLSRSPVVRRGTQAGVYALDLEAPARLRRELDALHDEVRGVTVTPTSAADLAASRARRAELNVQIGQVEKALVEASGVLGADVSDPSLVAA
jgi:hypothetical protein